mmetsp:Transcript_89258/g.172896  ORF Transcript_89258/g.172896 Transcript_89258/m.172896 type:complete len:594 (+) Transcript_89258:3-1784(+)
MGPSGSGKTTLLNLLAGRAGYQDGTIRVNNRRLSKDMKRSIAYVTQEDVFFDHLTIRDQLTYTALLRLPKNWSRKQKDNEVQQVVSRLRLTRCVDTPIVLISGGERKRVNIGSELLTNPPVLLLDEPTSGLDSTSAVALIGTLKSLAAEGRTICTSIHQPSSSVFRSFDRLLLLAEGHVVFSGTPTGSLSYFKKLGFPCPSGYNAADHCMDLLVIDSGIEESLSATDGSSSESSPTVLKSFSLSGGDEEKGEETSDVFDTASSTRAQLIAAWDNDKGALEVEKLQAECDLKTNAETTDASRAESSRSYQASYCTQLQVLTHRSLKNSRSALFTPVNFVKSVILSIIVGLCWFQMPQREEYVDDRSGFMFFAMTYWVFDSMFGAMLAFPSEKAIIDKERSSGSYHLSAYFLAKTLSELPCRMLMPCLYIFIAYWMAGMNPSADAFFGYASTLLLAVLVGESLGLLIGATVPNFEKAIMVMTLVSLALMLTGGFFVQNIPSFFSWVKYLSPFKYAYDSCVIFEFSGVKTPCDGSGVLPDCMGSSEGYVNGEAVIEYLGVKEDLGFNMGMLVVLLVGLRTSAYLALRQQPIGGARQ